MIVYNHASKILPPPSCQPSQSAIAHFSRPLRFHRIRPRGYNLSRRLNLPLEVLNRLLQPFVHRHPRLPIKLLLRLPNVRLPLSRIIRHLRQVLNIALAPAHIPNLRREVLDRVLFRIPNINGSITPSIHELDQSVDQIVHVLKAARVRAVAVDGNVLVLEGLDYEVGYDPAVVGVHAGSECVEDAGDADGDVVLVAVGAHHGFGDAFSFVVT
mmetsp:Transcript_13758/g.22442  ORF Transcript_13758/g.22442 Transcript_13758/m.22442 type:complete len:213 (-) Transcript_13758:435-1073(-)